MKKIRKKFRFEVDMDAKKLLEGLPIEFCKNEMVKVSTGRFVGIGAVRTYASGDAGIPTPEVIGWRVLLALMDEQKEVLSKDPNRCAICGWPLKENVEGREP